MVGPSPRSVHLRCAPRVLTAHISDSFPNHKHPDICLPLSPARRAATNHVAPVVPIGALTRYDRPAPSLTGYDDLLDTRTAP
jgi:hypothetical protein